MLNVYLLPLHVDLCTCRGTVSMIISNTALLYLYPIYTYMHINTHIYMHRVHGYMVGYIRAFDRHFNLVLTDVDEVIHYQVNILYYTT